MRLHPARAEKRSRRRNIQLVNPLLGYAALRVAASQYNASHTQTIACETAIARLGADLGRGIQIDGCQNCTVESAVNTATDHPLVLGTPDALNATCGSSQQVSGGGGAIIGDGNEQSAEMG